MSVTSDHKICDLPWRFFLPRLFHVSALMCNITSKNSCGHRRLNWQQRRGGLSPQVLMGLCFCSKKTYPRCQWPHWIRWDFLWTNVVPCMKFRRFAPGTAVSSLLIFIAPCEVTWFHSFMFEFRIFHVLSFQNWHSTSTPKCQLGNIMFKWRPRPCEEAQLRKMKLQNQETSPWHGGRKALGPWWVSLLVTCQSCTGG